jgi:hypothetical protein
MFVIELVVRRGIKEEAYHGVSFNNRSMGGRAGWLPLKVVTCFIKKKTVSNCICDGL